jgi:hypothetical protein
MLFTTGSRLFYGLAVVALVAGAVFAVAEGYSPYGTILLGTFAGVALFVGSMVIAFRDAEAGAMRTVAGSPADAEGLSASGPAVSPSAWPVIGAFGAAALVIGLVLDRRLFLLGVIVLVVTLIEWMVTAWADRRSASRGFNLALRGRTLQPLEFPILGVLIAAFIVLGLSRVLLAATEYGAIAVFSAIALVVFVIGIVIAARPAVSQAVIVGILGIAGVGVLAAGIGGAISGEREFEKKEKPTAGVSDTAGALATISLRNGQFELEGPGVPAAQQDEGPVIFAPRATSVVLVFQNFDPGVHQLVVREGEEEIAASVELEERDEATTLVLNLPRSGEYEFVTEGTQGGAEVVGRIEVP